MKNYTKKLFAILVVAALFASFFATSADYASDCDALFEFSEGTGSTTTDSISSLVGTFSGADWSSEGKFGNCVVSDSSTDLISVPDSAIITPTTSVSVAVWFNVDTIAGYASRIVSKSTSTSPSTTAYDLIVGTTGYPSFVCGGVTLTSSTSVSTGSWHLFIAIFDSVSNAQVVYLDNNLVGSTVNTNDMYDTTGHEMQIGNYEGLARGFLGKIDSLRIYKDYVLTAGDINNLWLEGNPEPTATPTATPEPTATPTPEYLIRANNDVGCTIDPIGDVYVESGNNQTFAITARDGYALQSLFIDGIYYQANASYTFFNVTDNHQIYATSQALPYGGSGGTTSDSDYTPIQIYYALIIVLIVLGILAALFYPWLGIFVGIAGFLFTFAIQQSGGLIIDDYHLLTFFDGINWIWILPPAFLCILNILLPFAIKHATQH